MELDVATTSFRARLGEAALFSSRAHGRRRTLGNPAPVGPGEKHVGKTGIVVQRDDAGADVVGQRVEIGEGEARVLLAPVSLHTSSFAAALGRAIRAYVGNLQRKIAVRSPPTPDAAALARPHARRCVADHTCSSRGDRRRARDIIGQAAQWARVGIKPTPDRRLTQRQVVG